MKNHSSDPYSTTDNLESPPGAKTLKAHPTRLDAHMIVRQSLVACPAPVVASRLGVSEDLVHGWVKGRSLPNLGHVLMGPASFGRRVLLLSSQRLDLVALAPTDPREAVSLLLCTLGGLLVMSKRPIESLSDRELRQAIEDSRSTEQQAKDLAGVYEAELQRRAEQPRERKGEVL